MIDRPTTVRSSFEICECPDPRTAHPDGYFERGDGLRHFPSRCVDVISEIVAIAKRHTKEARQRTPKAAAGVRRRPFHYAGPKQMEIDEQ